MLQPMHYQAPSVRSNGSSWTTTWVNEVLEAVKTGKGGLPFSPSLRMAEASYLNLILAGFLIQCRYKALYCLNTLHGRTGDVFPCCTMIYFALLATTTVILTFFLRRYRTSKNLPLPPSPKGWPLIGNLLDIPSHSEWITYHKWSKELGE